MSHKKQSHRQRRHHDDSTELSMPTSRHHISSSSEVLFTIDRRGDTQNLRYGSIDKYKVPKYRIAGYGRLVGLDRRFKIVSNSATEREIDNEALDSSSKVHSFASQLRQYSHQNDAALLKPDPASDDEFTEQHNYVALGPKRRRVAQNNKANNQDLTHVDSLLHFQSRSGSSSDSDSGSSGTETHNTQIEQDAFETFKNHPDNKKFIHLRTQTDINPQNVEAWLGLIDHQERYYILSTGQEKKSLNFSQSRTVTDMRVSLYEKAIPLVKDKKAKEKLILGLMKEGAKIWDTNKQLEEWRSALARSKSLELWYAFLNFQQTNATTFSYEQGLEIYLEILRITMDLSGEDHDYHCVYLVLRLTTFIYEAGFSERAIAIWQAFLEYNLLSKRDADRSIQVFEAFWESEIPRIGEVGAKGWQSGFEPGIPTRSDGPLDDLDPGRLLSDWRRAETSRSRTDVMPARTLDDTVEDDPYRVILFSDVKDFIIQLETDQGHEMLQQGFLMFCGVPNLFNSSSRAPEWRTDPFLCDFGVNMTIGQVADTSVLFTSPSSPSYIWEPVPYHKVIDRDFVVRILTQLISARIGGTYLIEYTIALQLDSDQLLARRLAKRLLKENPNNLLLYNAYALVEARSDKIEVSNNVWSTALSMSASLGPESQEQKIVLWHSWICELMTQHAYAHALYLLTAAIPAESITLELLQRTPSSHEILPGERLRADAYHREAIANTLSKDDESLVNHTALYAIMKYLQNNNDIGNAFLAYRSTLSLINRQRFPHICARLHQHRAWLAHFHAVNSTSGYRPRQIVSIFDESMLAFPDNPIISKLHDHYLRQAGIIDRVRMLNHEGQDLTPTIMPTLLTIVKEISRPLYAGSTVHSIRRAFANATATDCRARHCPALWLSWIQWEQSVDPIHLGVKENKVKDVYLSALRSCPWVKELYLEGFADGNLSRAMGKHELKQVYRTMTERGLRIRHDIVEVLDDSGNGSG